MEKYRPSLTAEGLESVMGMETHMQTYKSSLAL